MRTQGRGVIAVALTVTAGLATGPDATAARPVPAAERNYQAGVCGPDDSGRYLTANVGGWNQNGQWVHTPNFELTGGSQLCGLQPHWWFKPTQTLEINARDFNGNWRRFFRNFAKCSTAGGWTDRRWCTI